MNIKQNLVNESKYNIKCPYEMTPEFVVIHNTANDANAENDVAYMIRNDNKVSFHYAVDDKEVVQGILENRNAWHAGDGGKGEGNRKGIAVEICYSKSGGDRFIQAEKNAAEFVASLLEKYSWGIDKVKKHKDFANKNCPHRTLAMGWDRFLDLIEEHLDVEKANDIAKIARLADEVIAGKYGTGAERKRQLGDLYEAVQAEVNRRYGVIKTTKEYYPKCNYNGGSIVEALKSIGVDSSMKNRKKIAAKNGIDGYRGTANQNNALLDKLKAGKLIK